MEQGLISKKELLELTGISYGQLYRWKRKELIPEDWFIRKSTFTGQETFFPKDKILARIDKIQNMKDGLSLDEIADMFSPNAADIKLSKSELLNRRIVSSVALDLYMQAGGRADVLAFEQILFVYTLDKALQTGNISREEGGTLLEGLAENFRKFEGKNCELLFVRKLGMSTCLLVSMPNTIFFEEHAKIVVRLNMAGCVEELKLKITQLEGH